MKFAFSTALIAAIAVAQEDMAEPAEYYEDEPTVGEEIAEAIQEMFEVNEDGQIEFVHPELPTISWTDVDEAEIQAWAEDKENQYRSNDLEWAAAWESYQSAIAQPWNDFLTKAEENSRARDQIDIQTTEEMINFVTENTFVDGMSLKDMYPEVNDWIAQIEAEYEANQEKFSLDKFRIPVDMKRRNRTLQYDNYYYEEPYYYDYEEQEPSAFEEAVEQAAEQFGEALISWGFEPEVVDKWFSDKSVAWTDLIREQDKQSAEMAQQDVKEASVYIKSILDNMVTDIRSTHAENQAEFETEIDARVADLKAEIDRQSIENIDALQQWIDDTHADVQEFTEMSYDELQDATVSFAIEGETTSDSTIYGYGLLAFGAAAATAAFLYKKKQDKAQVMEGQKESLLDEDEEFVMV